MKMNNDLAFGRPVSKKPRTGGPMPRFKQPAGDENDSYLKPGQPDVDDTPGKKYPQTGGPMPKFQMPSEGNGRMGIGDFERNQMNQKKALPSSQMRKQAISKRLGK